DMTLEFGFLEDIDAFASKMRKDLQMLSFSATIPNQLQHFLKKYMHAPVTVKIEDSNHTSAPKIEHIAIPCKHLEYEEKLLDVLKGFDPYVCLIFANTRQQVAKTAQVMREHGYDIVELHGDMPSRARKNAMKELLNLDKSYIVASDIAARGIDIKGVSHVISLGFPNEIDFYIHRAGRCGRAGMSGVCYSLYKNEDELAIRQLVNKGISFKYQNIKNGNWIELKDKNKSKERKASELDIKINKIVNRKTKTVKPGYKKKRKAEVEKLKRKAKRNMIHEQIQMQKKERAIANQIKKRGIEE
ncbi:MAG: helicase-related protein, partial [Traorella sp.]